MPDPTSLAASIRSTLQAAGLDCADAEGAASLLLTFGGPDAEIDKALQHEGHDAGWHTLAAYRGALEASDPVWQAKALLRRAARIDYAVECGENALRHVRGLKLGVTVEEARQEVVRLRAEAALLMAEPNRRAA